MAKLGEIRTDCKHKTLKKKLGSNFHAAPFLTHRLQPTICSSQAITRPGWEMRRVGHGDSSPTQPHPKRHPATEIHQCLLDMNWNTSPYLKDKCQMIWMFVSVPRRFTDSHLYNNTSNTPHVTASTIALSTQHLARYKPVNISVSCELLIVSRLLNARKFVKSKTKTSWTESPCYPSSVHNRYPFTGTAHIWSKC